jgi:catechol 2,3-dioxygenase-like lactoylglutathione lyase family enzyme
MLQIAHVLPTLPVIDLNRARKFYEETLGLMLSGVDGPPAQGISYNLEDGSSLYIYQRGATKADHTAATFWVDDVEAEVKELKAKGVVFQDIEVPSLGIKTVEGIATMGTIKGAWFNDTEGNILGITEFR